MHTLLFSTPPTSSLSTQTNENELLHVFSQHGAITDVKIVMDRFGMSKGWVRRPRWAGGEWDWAQCLSLCTDMGLSHFRVRTTLWKSFRMWVIASWIDFLLIVSQFKESRLKQMCISSSFHFFKVFYWNWVNIFLFFLLPCCFWSTFVSFKVWRSDSERQEAVRWPGFLQVET